MELAKLDAVLRPRTAWEAIDLGFAMGRRWLWPIHRAWLATVVPLYALVWALLFDHPVIAILVVWWLKPLWDQAPLYVVSRALFGEIPTVGATLRALPGLWARQLLVGLVVHRLSPSRSFLQPVMQLERQAWSAFGRRRRALSRGTALVTTLLTSACLALEAVVAVGFLGLLALFVPDGPSADIGVLAAAYWDGTAPLWVRLAVPAVAFLALTVVEPSYVMAGFGLYINRRTHLEGWDVELVFRRLAGRIAPRQGPYRRAGTVVALLLALALPGGAPRAEEARSPASAGRQELASPPPGAASPSGSGEGPGEAIRGILAREEFGSRSLRRGFRRRHEAAPSSLEMPSGLSGLGSCLALGIEPVMWGLFALALMGIAAFVLSRVRRSRGVDRRRARPAVPAARVGVSIPPPSALPADVPAAARALWEQGLRAHALGLLYRGAVGHLVEAGGIPIVDGATERECLRLVRRGAAEATAAFFAQLTGSWQAVAYAHRPPADEAFLRLCDGWAAHFGAAR